MADPFLYSINHMLNDVEEEGSLQEDASCAHAASYQTILRSLYDIIGGEHPLPPNSSVVSANLSAQHIPNQVAEKPHAELEQAPIKLFNDGQLITDTEASLWEKDKTLKAIISFGSSNGRGSNAHFQLHDLKLAEVEFSFEDLKLHDHYAALYMGEPGTAAGSSEYGNKETALAVTGKQRRGTSGIRRKRTANNLHEYVDLRDLIFRLGQAVAMRDARVVNELYNDIRQVHGACADGNASQRAAHYFSEALVARTRGTGGDLFRACMVHYKQPSAVAILKFYKMSFEVSPLAKIPYYFANQSILKAAEQASRLHIVVYGLEYGIQWPFLINALADQKGGPPLLVITGIDYPQAGNNPAARLEESGRRLAVHARTYNVPFQFHAIVSSNWQDLDSSCFHFHDDEVLVVNCIKSIDLVADESENDALQVSPRQKLLTRIHSLKPHLLITVLVNAAYNSSTFVSRFHNALYYYSNVFDMLETVWGETSPERLLRERALYHEILNIVACEGAERVQRAETYKQWQVRIQRAGFQQLLIPPLILSRSKSHLKLHYHKEFFVHDDANKWMLLGWKGRTLVAFSAWKLSHQQL